MHVTDWIKKLDGFLTLNEREILTHMGLVSANASDIKPEKEFDKYLTKQQAIEAATTVLDFDRAIVNDFGGAVE